MEFNCQSCYPGFIYSSQYNSCLAQAPLTCASNQYLDRMLNQCVPCHPTCLTCFGMADYCLTCTPPLKLEGWKQNCADPSNYQCPTGMWKDPNSTRVCTDSVQNCLTLNPDMVTCSECKPNYALTPNRYKCVQGFYNGYDKYYAGGSPLTLYPCDINCLVGCIGPGPQGCLTTAKCYLFKDGPSNDYCDWCYNGKYQILTTRTCGNCHPNCQYCYGPLESDCGSCKEGFMLYDDNRTCRPACPEGQYGSIATGSCLPCHQSCLTCSGPTKLDCRSCKTNTTPVDYFFDGRCISCPYGYVLAENQCVLHTPTCLTWIAPYYSNWAFLMDDRCTSCKVGETLIYNSNPKFDTKPNSPTFNTWVGGFGYCVETPNTGIACPSGYK
jgi:proprotein convertase subtilisin/kexin type 5